MSNSSLDLSNKLPSEQVNIIRQVVGAAESQRLRLFIVGAHARDLLLQYVYDLPVHRATNDIDFGIIVESWDEFTKLRDSLIATDKFQPHRTMKHRLVHENGLLVDLVPFGGLEEVSGQISWPPEFSIVMSTIGFREAFDNSFEVSIANDLIVKVAISRDGFKTHESAHSQRISHLGLAVQTSGNRSQSSTAPSANPGSPVGIATSPRRRQ